MPRPANLCDLWQRDKYPEGLCPDSFPFWWDHYSQARTFYPIGLGEVAVYYGATNKKFLNSYIPEAIRICKSDWARILPYPPAQNNNVNFWNSCTTTQLSDSLISRPMCLAKIGICVTALDLFIQKNPVDGKKPIDVYESVFIALGSCSISNFTKKHYKDLADKHQDKLAKYRTEVVKLVRPGRGVALLQDIAERKINVSYPVAKLVSEILSTPEVQLVPEVAKRAQAGMRPASSHLVFVPKALPEG